MVFTLKAEVTTQDGKPTVRTTHEFVADDLHQALDQLSLFLRGCGYSVGYLTDADEPNDAIDNLPALPVADARTQEAPTE